MRRTGLRSAHALHADTGTVPDLDYDLFVAELTAADRRLAASAERYERVVIWTETR